MQKINILNFDQITSQAGRQPGQFAQLAPERAGLQGEHYLHEFDAHDAPLGRRQQAAPFHDIFAQDVASPWLFVLGSSR